MAGEPTRRRVLGDSQVLNLPAIVAEDDHHVQKPKRRRGNDEHIGGGNPVHLIA
jgi:hypothetical protein